MGLRRWLSNVAEDFAAAWQVAPPRSGSQVITIDPDAARNLVSLEGVEAIRGAGLTLADVDAAAGNLYRAMRSGGQRASAVTLDAEAVRRIAACERHVWIVDPAIGLVDCEVFCRWCSARTTAPNMTVAASYAERKFPSRAGRRERAERRRRIRPARVTR